MRRTTPNLAKISFKNQMTETSRALGFLKDPEELSVGYARVSIMALNFAQQFDVLTIAGCDVTFGGKVISTIEAGKGPELKKELAEVGIGDTLVISKLDRLGRTKSEGVARLADLKAKDI